MLREKYKRLLICILLALSAVRADYVLSQGEMSVISVVERGVVYVEVETVINAPYEMIWSVLTDYDRLASYIPGMRSSRLLRYEGDTAFVEQRGVSKIFFFEIPIDVIVRSIERRPHNIDIELVSGNLDHLSGGYELTKAGTQNLWKLVWKGRLDPSLPIPNFIAERIIRSNIRNQFLGVIEEVSRRRDLSLIELEVEH